MRWRLVAIASMIALTCASIHAQPAVKPLASRVFVIGHRGASAWLPEHTLASYARAIADGADFIEPDLVVSKDGVLIARHENEIGSTTDVAAHAEFAARKTTKNVDGNPVSGWFTEDFTFAELKTLRARERLPELRGTRNDGAFQIPSFDEIIDFTAAEASARGRVIGLIPEIKHATYFHRLGFAMEDSLLASLSTHVYTRNAPIEIQSFEIANLRYLREKIGRTRANLRLLQLLDEPQQRPFDEVAAGHTLSYADMMKPAGLREIARYADAIGPWTRSIIALDARGALGAATPLVRDAHAAGLEVHPYTFRPENHFLPTNLRDANGDGARNEAGSIAEIHAYLAAGIDAFFTDDPALGRKAVDDTTRR